MLALKKIYQERSVKFKEKAEALAAKYNSYSFVRLGVFMLGVGLMIYLWSIAGALGGIGFIFLFLLGFARFVFWHQAIKADQIHHEHLHVINSKEIAALEGNYQVFESGEAFKNPEHPYSVDLDIFGPYSFFQYSNRTATAIGAHRLAAYYMPALAPLKTQADLRKTPAAWKKEVLQRQDSIAELKDKLDWRQHFQASGMATQDDIAHTLALEEWLHQTQQINGNKSMIAALYIVPIIAVIGLIVSLVNMSWYWLIPFFLPSAFLLKKTFEYITKTAHQTGNAAKIIAYYGTLISYIEKEDFETSKLQGLKQTFIAENGNASKEIKRLSYLITQLNVRNNIFAIFLNLIGLWDLQWTYRLEQWKAAHKTNLGKWFDSLAEFEALISLATVYYNNPDWVMPIVSEKGEVVALQMGHPLIAAADRVCNDINIPTKGHIKLVTGSNMAGKSTMLRTVGLNIVLTSIGAPVCAQHFETPLLQVYTSMRTQDALHESTSSFYAELKRLKFIIEAVEEEGNIFFLLDEILKGTNSNDRHTGSKALIKQLIKSKGSGIIATHDLELGALEANYGGAVENLCMEVAVADGKLDFDYTIKKGVSKSFNATLLMKNMGIRIGE